MHWKIILAALLATLPLLPASGASPIRQQAYPGIGRIVLVDFGHHAFELHFERDGRTMTFVAVRGPDTGQTETVQYTAVATAPGQYLVRWTEPVHRFNVVHVQNWIQRRVYTNISDEALVFTHFEGSLHDKGPI